MVYLPIIRGIKHKEHVIDIHFCPYTKLIIKNTMLNIKGLEIIKGFMKTEDNRPSNVDKIL